MNASLNHERLKEDHEGVRFVAWVGPTSDELPSRLIGAKALAGKSILSEFVTITAGLITRFSPLGINAVDEPADLSAVPGAELGKD